MIAEAVFWCSVALVFYPYLGCPCTLMLLSLFNPPATSAPGRISDFEEGQIPSRDGSAANVPPWEQGRKDVYRLRPGGEMKITMQFRDWGGMFMQHCHNTVHEDHALLMRWEINDSGDPFLRPLPTPIPRPQGVTFRKPDEVLPTA